MEGFFFQAEDGIRDAQESRGLGDVYKRQVEFILEPRQFSIINNKDKRVIEPGYFTISVGGKQPGFSGYLDPQCTGVLTGRIRLAGKEEKFDN